MKSRAVLIATAILVAANISSARAASPLPKVNTPVESAPAAGVVSVMDGMSSKSIPGSIISSENRDLRWRSNAADLDMSIRTSPNSDAVTYHIILKYLSTSPSHRLIRLSLSIPATGFKQSTFWDGLTQHKWDGKSLIERDNIEYTFPMSCLWDDRTGLAIGFTPDTLTSSLHSGVIKGRIFYQTKLVVDKDHPQTLTFVVYHFKPTFGYLDAVQRYYDMYPNWFKPIEGIDRRVYGCGGYYISSDKSLRLQLHTARRVGLDWEWTYAPWVISGDYYPDQGDWVEDRDVIRNYNTYADQYKGTWKEYNRVRKAGFEQGDKTTAMFYYLLVKDANLEFVTNGYSEAQSVLKNGTKSSGGMNAIPGEKTTYVFPYGTPLADRIENELRQVVRNYDISGFAFDMANHGIDDYGPAQLRYGVGRSFDENGKIYSPDTLVGVFFADAIHKMKRGHKPMGVIMNQAISRSQCFPVFHADGVMYEQGPAMNPQNVMPLRLMSGRKPMTFWGSVECARLNGGIRWDYMTDAESAKKIIAQLSQHYLFTCLRIGASPMTWAARDLGYDWIQTIEDLKIAGWNPAPAVVSSDNDLWIGRFGSGTSTIISVTNPKRHPVKADLKVLSSYIGGGSYAFVSDQGQQIIQNVDRTSTRFTANLKPKEIMILRCLSIDSASGSVKLVTKRDESTGYVRLAVSGHSAGTVISSINRSYLGYSLFNISGLAKGDTQQMTPEGYRIKLGSKKPAVIGLVYKPASQFLSLKEEVLQFYTEDAGNMCIVIPDNASRTEMTVAEQLEAYYSFVEAFKERPVENEPALMNKAWDSKPGIPIIRQSAPEKNGYSKRIVVGTLDRPGIDRSALNTGEMELVKRLNGGFLKISPDGSEMWIGGKTDSELSSMSEIYFRLMDRKNLGHLNNTINWVPKAYR